MFDYGICSCPNCGSSLEIRNSDSQIKCNYCGTAFFVKDVNVYNNYKIENYNSSPNISSAKTSNMYWLDLIKEITGGYNESDLIKYPTNLGKYSNYQYAYSTGSRIEKDHYIAIKEKCLLSLEREKRLLEEKKNVVQADKELEEIRSRITQNESIKVSLHQSNRRHFDRWNGALVGVEHFIITKVVGVALLALFFYLTVIKGNARFFSHGISWIGFFSTATCFLGLFFFAKFALIVDEYNWFDDFSPIIRPAIEIVVTILVVLTRRSSVILAVLIAFIIPVLIVTEEIMDAVRSEKMNQLEKIISNDKRLYETCKKQKLEEIYKEYADSFPDSVRSFFFE